MTAWVSLGLGNVRAGEQDLRALPKYPAPTGTKVGVIFCHSLGSWATEPLTPNWSKFVLPIAAMGHPILATDMGGNNLWGNATAQARITEAKAYLHSAMGAKTGPILLIGMSMGGMASLAWAGQNPTLVAGLIGVAPVCDPTDVVTNDRAGLAASINNAYVSGWSEATYGAAYNPTTHATAGTYADIPMILFSGNDDPLVMPSTVSYIASQAAPGSYRYAVVGQHTIPVPVQPVIDFVTGLNL